MNTYIRRLLTIVTLILSSPAIWAQAGCVPSPGLIDAIGARRTNKSSELAKLELSKLKQLILQDLESSNLALRAAAFRDLVALKGVAVPWLVPLLHRKLSQLDERSTTIYAIAALAKIGECAIPALDASHSDDAAFRTAIVAVLSLMESQQSKARLLTFFNDKDEQIRYHSTIAFINASFVAADIPVLLWLIDEGGLSDSWVKLSEALRDYPLKVVVARYAAARLIELGDDAIRPLLELYETSALPTQITICRLLGEIKTPTLMQESVLEGAVQSESVDLAITASRALISLGVTTHLVVARATQLIQSSNPDVQVKAASVLVAIDSPESLAVVSRVAEAKLSIKSQLWAILAGATVTAESLPYLLPLLRSDDEQTVSKLIVSISKTGPKASGAREDLLALLSDRRYMRDVMRALAAIAPGAQDVTTALIALLSDRDFGGESMKLLLTNWRVNHITLSTLLQAKDRQGRSILDSWSWRDMSDIPELDKFLAAEWSSETQQDICSLLAHSEESFSYRLYGRCNFGTKTIKRLLEVVEWIDAKNNDDDLDAFINKYMASSDAEVTRLAKYAHLFSVSATLDEIYHALHDISDSDRPGIAERLLARKSCDDQVLNVLFDLVRQSKDAYARYLAIDLLSRKARGCSSLLDFLVAQAQGEMSEQLVDLLGDFVPQTSSARNALALVAMKGDKRVAAHAALMLAFDVNITDSEADRVNELLLVDAMEVELQGAFHALSPLSPGAELGNAEINPLYANYATIASIFAYSVRSSQGSFSDITGTQCDWPPPMPSTFSTYSKADFHGVNKLSDIFAILSSGLTKAGYLDTGKTRCGDGFEIITKLERIKADGTPFQGVNRWTQSHIPLQHFSVRDYFKALFLENDDEFRLTLFIVNSAPAVVPRKNEIVNPTTHYLDSIGTVSEELLNQSFKYCHVFIYHFRKIGRRWAIQIPDPLNALQHLQKAGLNLTEP